MQHGAGFISAGSLRNKTCTVLHQVGVSFDLYYDARKHKIKKSPDLTRKLSANLYDVYHCCVYGEKLLMIYSEAVRNM